MNKTKEQINRETVELLLAGLVIIAAAVFYASCFAQPALP